MIYQLKSNQYIPYKAKRLPSGMPACATYYYIVNKDGKVINKYTLKPYRGKDMDKYAFHDKFSAEQFVDNLNKSILLELGKSTLENINILT